MDGFWDYLGSHVSGRPTVRTDICALGTCIRKRVTNDAKAKINNLDIQMLIQQYILRLKVPMNDIHALKVIHSP